MTGPEEPGWWVYVLRNSKTNEVYTGCTNDVEERLKTHQNHPTRGAKTTRRWVLRHGPGVVCKFAQVGPMTKSAAQSLERKWKNTTAGMGSVEVGISLLLLPPCLSCLKKNTCPCRVVSSPLHGC